MYHYKIQKLLNSTYVLTKEEVGLVLIVDKILFNGSKQECIDMYNKNFERPYSTINVTVD
jgi:hypothetical protein